MSLQFQISAPMISEKGSLDTYLDKVSDNCHTSKVLSESQVKFYRVVLYQHRVLTREMDKIISKLPRLDEKQIIALGHEDSVCPICFLPLTTLLAEEKTGLAMDSPAYPIEELGIIRLAEPYQCNHIFCRRDISRWVKEGHDSCPTCRRPLLERIGDADASANSTSASPAENAYDPSQLANILQHLQGFGIDSFPEFPETQSDASEFFAFLSRPDAHLRRTSHNDDRNEYSAMYS
ncbi:hypothetical protein F5051DRAFT_29229 [Lentinula edodes]|nr:hypothetical protein F5051DRAFT_29229 [Lentinula edodes]